jgi:hypothetical protein
MEYKSELIDFEKEDMESKKRMLGSDKVNIEEIKALRIRITPSPWIYDSKMIFDGMDLKERWIRGPKIRSNYTDDTIAGQTANADCEFVASSPEIVDYLLSIIEQAEKALEQFTRGNFYLATENNAWSNYRHTEDAPWKIAEEALQAIRK